MIKQLNKQFGSSDIALVKSIERQWFWIRVLTPIGFPWWLRQYRICLQCRRPRFSPRVGTIPWRRKWQRTAVFLPREFYVKRSLAGCSPWGYRRVGHTFTLFFTFLTVTLLSWNLGQSYLKPLSLNFLLHRMEIASYLSLNKYHLYLLGLL